MRLITGPEAGHETDDATPARSVSPLALVLLSVGLLAQHQGAVAFFAAVAAAIFFLLLTPVMIRWNREAHNWSDHLATPRAPEVEQLIDVLASASRDWVRSSG